jgi:small subunit ribosomal protein S1
LEGDIDGLIHLSDISDDDDPKDALEEYKKGDKLECIVFAGRCRKRKNFIKVE